MYFNVSSITNVFLHRSNKVKKQEKKQAHRRNDVWNASEMLSILGGCPSLNPSPASIFGLFTTRYKRKFKGKENRRSRDRQRVQKKKKIILFCNQRDNGDIIKKLKLRCCEKETLLLGQCNKSEQVRHGSVFLLFFFFFFFHVIQYQCLSDACV